MGKRSRGKTKRSGLRRLALKGAFAIAIILLLGSLAGEWYVHHPRKWLDEQAGEWPKIATAALCWLGNPVADITDALGWTGHDAVYEYDVEAPRGSVLFAGAPVRVGAPAPSDLRILNRGEFLIGWSDSLRHPVWCAYHVRPEAKFEVAKRPSFLNDRALASAPHPGDYTRSGYDRGHMVPNYAIQTRYGTEAQRLTFMMSNIAPQTPALNRGVWREVEHRIADLWTSRYGELWVIVGAISAPAAPEKIGNTEIDVPIAYYQIIIAQTGMEVRALAVHFSQQVGWNEWAARNIVTIDELEELTGLDFNPELDDFIQDPLEAELPTRLWPIRTRDIFKQIRLRFP